MDTLEKQIDGSHYRSMELQPWVIIEKNKLDYFHGAVLKYLLRWQVKDGVIDLDKIIHYVEHIKQLALAGHYGNRFIPKTVDEEFLYKSPIQNWSNLFTRDMDNITRENLETASEESWLRIFGPAPMNPYKRPRRAKKKVARTRSVVKRTKTSPKRKKA